MKPHRKLGSPGPEELETQGRDEALDALEVARAELVDTARNIAIILAQRRKRITSVEVFAEMRAQGYDGELDSADPRWMGAVFREEIWERDGYETTGSHRRPVAIWRLRDPQNIPISPREKVSRLVSASKERGISASGIVLNTGMSHGQARKILNQMERAGKVLQLPKAGRRGVCFVLPEHHPDIV